jgi:hypothetical protein
MQCSANGILKDGPGAQGTIAWSGGGAISTQVLYAIQWNATDVADGLSWMLDRSGTIGAPARSGASTAPTLGREQQVKPAPDQMVGTI